MFQKKERQQDLPRKGKHIDMSMAHPAGYSSDGSSDYEGFSISGAPITKRTTFVKETAVQTSIEEQLISALVREQFEEVEQLLEKNPDLSYKSYKHGNWTALMHASSLANFNIVKLLLEKGAKIDDHHELLTPLLCLCGSKNYNDDELLNCLEILIAYKANVNDIDWYKNNALVYAIKQSHEKLITKLISLGCNLENKDYNGWTPIFFAVNLGDLRTVQILKDAGANLVITDKRGRSLQDIALDKHNKEICDIVNIHNKDEDVNLIIDRKKGYKQMSQYEFVFSELPNRNKSRFSGFHCDAIRWIYGIGLNSLVNLFLEKDIQLNELLAMDDDDFKEFGVTLSYDRKFLKYCIQRFHEHSWGRNSLKPVPDSAKLDLTSVTAVLCNIIRNIHLCNAATYFVRKNKNNQISDDVKNYAEKGLTYIKYLEEENHRLMRLIKEIDKRDKIVPSDFIYPSQEKVNSCSKIKICISVALSLFVFDAFKPLPQCLLK